MPKIEPLEEAHWPQVLAIYLEGIATGNATFETAAPDWESWNASHLERCRLVARMPDGIDGWAALSPVSRRPAYEGVAEVSVYVAGRARGNGVGTALLSSLIPCSEAYGIWMLQSSVFPENEVTLRLHARAGFRTVGRRERIARHGAAWRDTLLLERRSLAAGS